MMMMMIVDRSNPAMVTHEARLALHATLWTKWEVVWWKRYGSKALKQGPAILKTSSEQPFWNDVVFLESYIGTNLLKRGFVSWQLPRNSPVETRLHFTIHRLERVPEFATQLAIFMFLGVCLMFSDKVILRLSKLTSRDLNKVIKVILKLCRSYLSYKSYNPVISELRAVPVTCL